MDKNYVILSSNTANGEKVDKIICELKDEDWKLFKLLGKAVGTDIWHCIYLGNKYKENFWERVCGYRILEDEESRNFEQATGEKYISVQFFEKENSEAGENTNKQKESIGFRSR